MSETKSHSIGNYEGAFKIKECVTCLFTSDIAKIHDDGECEYCKLQKQLAAQANPADFWPIISKVKAAGKGKQYDCLIGISGGMDSSVMLYLAVKAWGLRPLAIHMDNRWNTPEADHNVKWIADYTNVNLVTYRLDKKEYDKLNDAFLAAGVPDADIPNDIAMTKLMYEAALKNDIKYILNGHDFRNEGSTPAKWTYMDARYIQDVYRQYTAKTLKNYPLFTFWDQIFYGLMGIKQVRPFHYSDHNYQEVLSAITSAGWKPYGAKHAENIYTEFVGAHLLPTKFGIDKRRVYLSAQIREGKLSKVSAKEILKNVTPFDARKLGDRQAHIMGLTGMRIRERTEFDRYDFKKWYAVIAIWILAKMKVVPYTFFKKYCK